MPALPARRGQRALALHAHRARDLGVGEGALVEHQTAGIATGALPTLGLRAGVQRDRVTVPASRETLDVVRAGLDDVVQRGTARELRWLAELGVCGKTGTAERTSQGDNNAWFAGYLPAASASGHQLAFCSVIYYVPDQSHGGDTAGAMAQDFFAAVASDPELSARYMPR